MGWFGWFGALAMRGGASLRAAAKQSRKIDCFVPRNDALDCFVPRNDVLDCFVPRNDAALAMTRWIASVASQ